MACILEAVEAPTRADETVVILLADQGGPRYSEPLREDKPGTSPYEGGARVPLLVRWPGNVSAEVRKPTPVISTDMLPTNVELARGDPSRLGPLDGVSLKPLLTGKGVIEREGLFLVRHQEDQYAAVVAGDLKLLADWRGMRELYNLAVAAGEVRDTSSRHPERIRELSELLAGWRADFGLRPELETR